MKRYGNLYNKVYDLDNLRLAHMNAKKGKTHYGEVKMVDRNPDKYLNEISTMLKDKTYRNSPYVKMTKHSDSGKVREIYKLPYYPDRIIHHAIMQVVGEIWKRSLIRDTYSSIKGRGIHDGVKRLKKALRDKDNTMYCLKLDVKKYYPSINNEIMKQVLRKKIKDRDLLWLLDEIIDSIRGMPIGNYLSQMFGNLYLSGLDHYCKAKGLHYFRYCDDIVVLHSDKAVLHNLLNEISQHLAEVKLAVKDNWQVFPVDARGIDFLGYRFFHDYVLLRKSIKVKLTRSINRIKKKHANLSTSAVVNSVMSYYGWFGYANCRNLQNSVFNKDICHIIKHKCIQENIKNPLKKVV